MTLCQIKFNKNKTKRFLPNANVTTRIIPRKKNYLLTLCTIYKIHIKINILLHKKRFAFKETRPRSHERLESNSNLLSLTSQSIYFIQCNKKCTSSGFFKILNFGCTLIIFNNIKIISYVFYLSHVFHL